MALGALGDLKIFCLYNMHMVKHISKITGNFIAFQRNSFMVLTFYDSKITANH